MLSLWSGWTSLSREKSPGKKYDICYSMIYSMVYSMSKYHGIYHDIYHNIYHMVYNLTCILLSGWISRLIWPEIYIMIYIPWYIACYIHIHIAWYISIIIYYIPWYIPCDLFSNVACTGLCLPCGPASLQRQASGGLWLQCWHGFQRKWPPVVCKAPIVLRMHGGSNRPSSQQTATHTTVSHFFQHLRTDQHYAKFTNATQRCAHVLRQCQQHQPA